MIPSEKAGDAAMITQGHETEKGKYPGTGGGAPTGPQRCRSAGPAGGPFLIWRSRGSFHEIHLAGVVQVFLVHDRGVGIVVGEGAMPRVRPPPGLIAPRPGMRPSFKARPRPVGFRGKAGSDQNPRSSRIPIPPPVPRPPGNNRRSGWPCKRSIYTRIAWNAACFQI